MSSSKVYENIRDFNLQFSFKPEVVFPEKLPKNFDKVVVCGMGGSHLAADLLKIVYSQQIIIHKNYGLPEINKNYFYIFSSHSGNTEEIIDGFKEASKKKLPMAVISTGGKLLVLAKRSKTPYIQIPNEVPPRLSVGYMAVALNTLMGKELSVRLEPLSLKSDGEQLAKKLKNKIPIIYSSEKNEGLALNWKIRFNESGKTPSFYNVFPELNHNEMVAPSSDFYYILIKDDKDALKIKKRMLVFEKLYKKAKLDVVSLNLKGTNIWEKVFDSIILADWTSYYLAVQNRKDPEEVPLVEDFKKMI